MAVKFEHGDTVDAPVEAVWTILTDPQQWPRFFPDVERVGLSGPLVQGAAFEVQAAHKQGTGTLAGLAPHRQLRVVTVVGGPPVTHTFELERTGGVLGVGATHTRVTYRMEYDPPGGAVMDFIAGGNPRDQLRAKGTVDKLKALAEGQRGR